MRGKVTMRKNICIHNEQCPTVLTPGIVFVQNLDFRGRIARPLMLHFIRPCVWYKDEDIRENVPQKDKLPTIIWISGGGFQTTQPLKYAPEFNYLVKKGYQVALVDYRVSGEAVFPAAVQDIKTAVRFLKANADKYGVDENRIAVMGDSAGGYLSTMLGATSEIEYFETEDWSGYDSSVKAVVDLYGPVDLLSSMTDSIYEGMTLTPIAKFLGERVIKDKELQKLINPIPYISEKTPPFLIMHGSNDAIVSYKQSELLYTALKQKGIPVDFYLVENTGHAGNEFWQEPIKEIISKFIEKYV